MHTSTPVTRWTWGRDDETADALVRCLRDLMAAYRVLATHRLAMDAPVVHVSLSEARKAKSFLFKGRMTEAARGSGVGENAEAAIQLVDQRADLRAGEVGSVVYTANGPRLAAVLSDLSEVLASETGPDDPTYFAKPTETGANNYFDADGSASDVWSSFEVPTRYDVFTHAPGLGRIGYRRTTEGEVRYVPVHGSQGELLGYLWASDAENAASFEPLDVGDNATYHAGLAWLERLRSAHDSGLSPSAALAEASATSDTSAGRVDPTCEPRTAALAVLRDRSQEGA